MRHVYLALILLLTLAVVVFTVQNIGSATVVFLNASLTLPLALLVVVAYLAGMASGGMVVSMLKSWVRGATRPPAAKN
jgi:uncharacterized integral membrane protein